MGAAKLAIKMENQKDHQHDKAKKYNSNEKGLPHLGFDHLMSATVSRGICDLIDLEFVRKFSFIFFNRNITKFFIDKERIILTGDHPKINDDDPGIAIHQ
jgi:hypothetical protein